MIVLGEFDSGIIFGNAIPYVDTPSHQMMSILYPTGVASAAIPCGEKQSSERGCTIKVFSSRPFTAVFIQYIQT